MTLPTLCLALTLAAAEGESQRALREAIATYEAFKFEQALQQLDALAGDPWTSDADRPVAHLYRGLVRAMLGKEELARDSFRAALRLDRELKLPENVSPKVQKLFEEARAQLPAPAPPPVAVSPAPPPPAVQREPAGSRAWIPAAAGTAATFAGITLLAMSRAHWRALISGDLPYEEAVAVRSRGEAYGTAGWLVLSAGLAAGAVALVWWLFVEQR